MSRAQAPYRAFFSDLSGLWCSIHRSKVCSTFWKWLQFLDGIWNMQFVPFHRLLPLRAVIRLPQNGNWLLMCRCRKFLNRVHFSYNAKSRWKLERSIKVLKVRLHHFLRVDVTKMTHEFQLFPKTLWKRKLSLSYFLVYGPNFRFVSTHELRSVLNPH